MSTIQFGQYEDTVLRTPQPTEMNLRKRNFIL